ncbi:MAG: SIR2 family protein, partial [Roseovarius sp.]|nr:SIR2 family protein [Roseovarius sp.]
MRFLADGPDIPDELLWAQDKGRVVFFCGAGVSMAQADLPDFRTLTKNVLNHLNAQPDSDAKRLFDLDVHVNKNHDIPGVVSYDRVFGLLERDFNTSQINTAVAKCLKTDDDVDLGAHKTLIKLGTLQSGKTRLVTTNFDRLFEKSNRSLNAKTRSSLSYIAYNEFDWGIVHLHGVVNDTYSGATQDGFVLSSASFGEAYLAGGWAREFVKSVLERHVAVFVGYQADDTPIRYLLEGLQSTASIKNPAFAFQLSGNADAIASWDEKGVKPIEYDT